MSFMIDETPVWNASYGDARLFISQARGFERLAGESGVGDIEDDESQIDKDKFTKFLSELVAIHGANPAPVQTLIHGFVSVAVVLAQRGNLEVTTQQWSDDINDLARSMPT